MPPAYQNNNEEENVAPPVKILLKKEWGGKFALALQVFDKRPIENVRFTDTMSVLCKTSEECKKEVLRLQTIHMEKLGLPDIQYNFLVCGDGTVYEGRGWNVESWKPKEYEHLQKTCLDVAFLTDLSDSKLTPEMKNAGENLVKYGKTLGYLKEDCNIIDQPK